MTKEKMTLGKSLIIKGIVLFALIIIISVSLLYAAGVSNQEYSNENNNGNSLITEKDIEIQPDRIIIKINNALIGKYAPTGSMLPVLNENTIGIKIVPESENEINIGDIVSFRKDGYLIIHRVVEKSQDAEGTYFITKGDNNFFSDGKIRFEDIEYKTIILIY